MKITIEAETPLGALHAVLGFLATNYGGYERAEDFIDLFNELGDTDLEVATNAYDAFMNLIQRTHGATAAILGSEAVRRQAEADQALPPIEEIDTPDGVDFVAPTATDFANLGGEFGVSEKPFFMRGGPEVFILDLSNPDNVATPPINADFGLGGDVITALHGRKTNVADKTAFERVRELSLAIQLAFWSHAPFISTLPTEKQHEVVDELIKAEADLSRRATAA